MVVTDNLGVVRHARRVRIHALVRPLERATVCIVAILLENNPAVFQIAEIDRGFATCNAYLAASSCAPKLYPRSRVPPQFIIQIPERRRYRAVFELTATGDGSETANKAGGRGAAAEPAAADNAAGPHSPPEAHANLDVALGQIIVPAHAWRSRRDERVAE